MGIKTYRRYFPNHNLAPCRQKLEAMNGGILGPKGTFTAELAIGKPNASLTCDITVCRKVSGTYLSLQTCKDLRLVPSTFPTPINALTSRHNRKGQRDTKDSVNKSSVWTMDEQQKWLDKLPEHPTEEQLSAIRKDIE